MIVPMEKITILIFHKAKQAFLSRLQDLGVVHISQDAHDVSDDILKNMHKRIEAGQAFLKAARKAKNKASRRHPEAANFKPTLRKTDIEDAFSYVESYQKAKDALERINDRIEKLERDIRNVGPWGEFDIGHVKKLKDAGINMRFFICPLKKFKEINKKDDIYLRQIFHDKTYAYFVVFERDKRVEFGCDEFFFPQANKKELETERTALRKEKKEKERLIDKLFARAQKVEEYLNKEKTELSYLDISRNLPAAAENTIYIINGWVPRPQKQKVESALNNEQIYFYFSKAQPEDAVPILLSNNRFARLFEPVTKLFSLPKYGTMDLTAFFAPFFTLFFGFCLSDAGYGLILFTLALFFKRKVTSDKRALLVLVMILGLSTFLFGLITGNLFGIDLSRISGIKKVVLFNQEQLFNFALVLGVIQVLFGMLLKAISRIRQFGPAAGLSAFGWIIMLCGLLGLTVSKQSIWAVYTGITLILLFNDLKANIFVRIGKGLWELYGISGVFGDVLSYIRLFALGISSSILGLVVNEIALEFRHIPVFGFVITFVILVVGHTGNLLLGGLSSFVHPLRLTFVEFYKNAGFESGGKAYNPFRQIN
ncbi:MAG: V-type ATPase 116kDa subunit family protein [Candidatus Omnitrophota bacterium]